MFAQGNICFFCRQPLAKAEASVEHLLASANGGSNHDENCVACCKAVNALLGSMSLKEKFQVVLNQRGDFKCPNGAGTPKTPAQAKAKVPSAKKDVPKTKLDLVLKNLKQRKSARPASIKTLRSTISSLFPDGISEADRDSLVSQLEAAGKITVSGTKVTYSL